jgi:SAM-dependent methyltransferase
MYAADLAYVHDAGFGDLARRAAPELIRILRAHGIRKGRIVEIGSGSGILARRLVDAGYDVIGFDRSADMIKLARKKAPKASFRLASLTRATIPRCVAVVATGEVVSYVSASLRPFFRRVYEALEPGGLLIFDFMESAKRRTFAGKSFGGRDWAMIVRADVDAASRILTRRMTILRKAGTTYRRTRETHHVQLRSRTEMTDALEAAGFKVRMSRSYGRYRLLPGDVAVVAQKK